MTIFTRAPFALAALAAASVMTVASTGPAMAAGGKTEMRADTHRVVSVRHSVSGPRRFCLVAVGAAKGTRPVCLTERQWSTRGLTITRA